MNSFEDNARQLRYIAGRLTTFGLRQYVADLRQIADDIDHAGTEKATEAKPDSEG